jgi:hypothetical protein
MSVLRKIYLFYYEGFCQMTVGKTLWIIILIKLFIIFVLFRILFFPDYLNTKFKSDQDKSDYVIEQLITKPK